MDYRDPYQAPDQCQPIAAIENRRSDGRDVIQFMAVKRSTESPGQMRGRSYQMLFMHPRVRLIRNQRLSSIDPRIELCSTLKRGSWKKMVAALMAVFYSL